MDSHRAYDSRGGSDECLTPRHVIEALGPFDLDPCYTAPHPWPTALVMVGLPSDGLKVDWSCGRVWCNPPYSYISAWAEKMAREAGGVFTCFARTGTRWFQSSIFNAPTASGILFLPGRLKFCGHEGNPIVTNRGIVATAGAPSVLVSYDREAHPFNRESLKTAQRVLGGKFFEL